MFRFETTMPSMWEPSTDSIARPERSREAFCARRKMVQLLMAMSLKSPLDSVPSLILLLELAMLQLVTVRCSVDRGLPSARLALGQIPSSYESINELAIRT